MDLITKAYGGELDYQRIEPLILSGAMDVFRRPRSRLLYELDAIFGNAPARMQISMDEQLNESSPGQAPSRNSWAGARSEESWAFQAELDVLGCVPSSLYYPEKGGSSLISACL
jgi:DNA polymerase III alpha subunit